MESKTIDVDGLGVHYLDFGGSGEPMVLVHGLGGSAINWLAVGDRLAQTGHRVLALDLAGFGRTPVAGRKSSVKNNVALLDSFLEKVAGGPAVLVGNSMGGLISVVETADHPQRVSRLVLVDPALPGSRRRRFDLTVWMFFAFLLTPLGTEAYLRRRGRRLGAEGVVARTLKVCCTNPAAVPAEIVRAHVELVRERESMPGSERALIQAARSLLALLARGRFDSQLDRVRCPVLLIQGRDDRLVPVEASLAVAQGRASWRVEVLDGVGHVPMLEAPDRFLKLVYGFLSPAEAA
jgi:pimeloyl-ACP methyl ester carboxylesterase